MKKMSARNRFTVRARCRVYYGRTTKNNNGGDFNRKERVHDARRFRTTLHLNYFDSPLQKSFQSFVKAKPLSLHASSPITVKQTNRQAVRKTAAKRPETDRPEPASRPVPIFYREIHADLCQNNPITNMIGKNLCKLRSSGRHSSGQKIK